MVKGVLMRNQILTLLSIVIISINSLYAENLATVLRGKIVANNLSGIEVMIKESDGSILDMTDISKTGSYDLDLTIMDTPSRDEVVKLIVEVKSKTGKKETFHIKNYITVFADTVLLKPIVLK